jgi:hypothetical protein
MGMMVIGTGEHWNKMVVVVVVVIVVVFTRRTYADVAEDKDGGEHPISIFLHFVFNL